VNNLNGKNLLPDSSLHFQTLRRAKQSWSVQATASPDAAACPECGVLSRARHSSYWRHLKDLPIQGRFIQLKLQVGRWRCRNRLRKHKIFCQRLPAGPANIARSQRVFGKLPK
jgi:transposase